jgi:hypothetical protein
MIAATAGTEVTSSAAFSARARFVYSDCGAFDGFAVHASDSRCGFLFVWHLDEGEASRFTGVLVLDDCCRCDLSESFKRKLDVFFRGFARQISHIDVHPTTFPFVFWFFICPIKWVLWNSS